MPLIDRPLTPSTLRRSAALLALILALPACDSSLNHLRTQRFAATPAPPAPQVALRAQALALKLSADGRTLTPESLQQANTLLSQQGRLADQVLTITAFNARGDQFAARLAQALQRSGASPPRLVPSTATAPVGSSNGVGGWDLELQSEALVIASEPCRIADSEDWAVHPYRGVGSLGCATRANLARMTRDPRDLSRPRTLDGGDGRAAANAVRRYQEDDLKELIDIDFEED